MAPQVTDDGGKPVLFWWPDVVRKVVACVVTTLIIAVSLLTVLVVLRPEDLAVSIVKGSASVDMTNPEVPGLSIQIAFDNRGGRGRVNYTGATAVLKDTSASEKIIVIFHLGDIIVNPHTYHWVGHWVYFSSLEHPYREKSPSNLTIPNAVLIFNGTLITTLYSVHNLAGLPTMYKCNNITVSGSSSVAKDADDVECSKN